MKIHSLINFLKGCTTLSIGLIVLFYLSVKLVLYTFLKSKLGILDSYLLDQTLFFLIFLTFLFISIIIKRKIIFTYKNIALFCFLILLFTGYFIFLLNFQSEILNRYFIKDDQFVMLPALLRPERLDYQYTNRLDYFYYHFGAGVMLFKFFHLDAYYFNVFTLATMALSATVLLKLLDRLNIVHGFSGNWSKFLIIIITFLYIVSPTIMDSFVYMEHSVAIGYVVAGAILSIYFYLRFLENKTKTIFFLLSFILMIFLLKTAMVRAGFLPACLVLLEVFNISRKKTELKSTLLRTALIFLPFYLIAKPYLSPDTNAPGRLYDIGIDRFIDLDRMYLFFANLIPVFMPFQFMSPIFRSIRVIILGDFNAPSESFFLNHMLFTGGVILFIFISAVILILFLKKKNAKYILYFWLCSLGSLLFYMLFGNVIEKQLPPPHFFDLSLLSYGTVPGSRYYPIPLIFLLTTLYLIFMTTTNRLGIKTKNFILGITTLILALTVWSNVNFTQEVNRSANEGIVTVKIITEKVLTIVPDNNEEKVIYSISGRINDVEYIIRGFHGFFKYKAPEYFWQEEELVKYLRDKKIEEENFFAFSFERNTLAVENESQGARKEFKNYLFERIKTP